MTFEEQKTITLTPEQAKIHIISMKVQKKNLLRKLSDYDWKIARYQSNRDLASALGKSISREWHKNLIEEIGKEIDRMEEVFGKYEDSTGEN